MPDEPVARPKPRLAYARGGGWSGAVTQARGDTSRPAATCPAGTRFSSGIGEVSAATTVGQLVIVLQFDVVPDCIGQSAPNVAVQELP